jgi:hypothetical protein
LRPRLQNQSGTRKIITKKMNLSSRKRYRFFDFDPFFVSAFVSGTAFLAPVFASPDPFAVSPLVSVGT